MSSKKRKDLVELCQAQLLKDMGCIKGDNPKVEKELEARGDDLKEDEDYAVELMKQAQGDAWWLLAETRTLLPQKASDPKRPRFSAFDQKDQDQQYAYRNSRYAYNVLGRYKALHKEATSIHTRDMVGAMSLEEPAYLIMRETNKKLGEVIDEAMARLEPMVVTSFTKQ